MRGATKSYGGVTALADVSFDASVGELVAIVGPNGAGKTTLFNCINGWTALDDGTISMQDVPLPGDPLRTARMGVSRSSQVPRIVPDLTVHENATLARAGEFTEDLDARAVVLLTTVGLKDRLDVRAELLTHGERKNLELLRVLLEAPRLALLDEPFAGLNQAETDKCIELMRAFTDAGGTMVFIEHDLKSVLSVASRVVVLDFGRLIADDSPQAVCQIPEVVDAYLAGGAFEHADEEADRV